MHVQEFCLQRPAAIAKAELGALRPWMHNPSNQLALMSYIQTAWFKLENRKSKIENNQKLFVNSFRNRRNTMSDS
jgi:hypothetical protein